MKSSGRATFRAEAGLTTPRSSHRSTLQTTPSASFATGLTATRTTPRTVTITSNATFTAYYGMQYNLSVAVVPSGAGYVDLSPQPDISGGGYWYFEGTSVQATATPAQGYA